MRKLILVCLSDIAAHGLSHIGCPMFKGPRAAQREGFKIALRKEKLPQRRPEPRTAWT